MNIRNELNEIVGKWNLLTHPFYQAWSAGTLPVEALQVYAREYGAFVGTLSHGWQTLNDTETASEEQEHAELWDDFTKGLHAAKGMPEIHQTAELVNVAQKLFASPATALGALYAFEVQQPETAKSKLHGLRAWYKVPADAEKYFEVHSTNWHESEKILLQISALSAKEQSDALEACARMSAALWNGLTGIQEKACID